MKTGQSIPEPETLPIVFYRDLWGLFPGVYTGLLTLSGVERNLAAPFTGGQIVPV